MQMLRRPWLWVLALAVVLLIGVVACGGEEKEISLLVSKQTYEPGAPDLSSQIINIQDAGAEVVVLGAVPTSAAAAIVAANTQGYSPQWVVSYVNAHTSLAASIGGGTDPEQLADGFALLDGTIADNYQLDAVGDKDDPAMVEHARIMEKYSGPTLSTLSVYGQSLAELTVEALSGACDNLTREGLLQSVESIQNFHPSVFLPGINVSFSATDHRAIEALQPVRYEADGTLTALGDLISVETPAGEAPAGEETPAADVTPGPGVTDTEIKLGHTNDLAGTGGTPYGILTTALQAYFKKVNDEDGGVCGRKITLIAEDDQYAPGLALEKTRKLVEQDKVLAIVGALGTAAHLGAVDYLNDPNGDGDTSDGIPDLFVSTGYTGWADYETWPWTFGYIPDYASDGKILATYINENFAGQKVGILYQNDPFGQDYLNSIEENLAKSGE